MRFPFSRKSPTLPPRHLIVGLGNPGAEYRGTRHNVGFRVVELLAERHRIRVDRIEKRSLVGSGTIADMPVLLAKPITFVNLSGESVAPLMRLSELRAEDVIVVTDDMDMPIGRLRVRRAGSAGGHNGLKNLIRHLGTEEFPRIRLGVGRPGHGTAVIDHVLSRFERGELEPVQEMIERAADAVEMILSQGVDAAMNRFNAKPAGGPAEAAESSGDK